jgi:hypothetical protein
MAFNEQNQGKSLGSDLKDGSNTANKRNERDTVLSKDSKELADLRAKARKLEELQAKTMSLFQIDSLLSTSISWIFLQVRNG